MSDLSICNAECSFKDINPNPFSEVVSFDMTLRVWCNPPYGREAVPFLEKLAKNASTGGGAYCTLRAQTLQCGTILFFLMPTPCYFYAAASVSAGPTARQETPRPRPQRLWPIRRATALRFEQAA